MICGWRSVPDTPVLSPDSLCITSPANRGRFHRKIGSDVTAYLDLCVVSGFTNSLCAGNPPPGKIEPTQNHSSGAETGVG